jgi:hypothetical protein
MSPDAAFERYRDVLQSLQGNRLTTLDEVLAPGVHFQDPLHPVTGADAMKQVFAALFETADDIVYVIDDAACSAGAAYFRWTLSARLSDKPWVVTGVTRIAFDESGRVTDHVEYWDAASQLFERFPIIGSLLRYVRRRVVAR